jgi:hypothetical protein
MYAQTSETALANFDQAVLEAATAGMAWAVDHKIEIKMAKA